MSDLPDLYKECYMYYDGRMVFTFDGSGWFSIDQFDNHKEEDHLDMDMVSYKIK